MFPEVVMLLMYVTFRGA